MRRRSRVIASAGWVVMTLTALIGGTGSVIAADALKEAAKEAAKDGAKDGGNRSWPFQVTLDGRPIGQHRFELSGDGEQRSLVSEANFAVKIIGITAYHYHHKATERWNGDCLASLNSTTDDDGKAMKVSSAQQGDGYRVTSPTADSAKGCVMSYAYWNPAIQTQTRLLNAQSGKIESVRVAKVGGGEVQVGGKPVAATQYRISGPNDPVDVWYSAQGDWVGLDAVVGGKRKLSYRLP